MDTEVKKYIGECSQMERFNLVTRLGNDILLNGGEIFRANEAMEYAAKALLLEGFNAYVIANGIFSPDLLRPAGSYYAVPRGCPEPFVQADCVWRMRAV